MVKMKAAQGMAARDDPIMGPGTVGSYGTIFVPSAERLNNDLRKYVLDVQTKDIRDRIEAPEAQHLEEAERARFYSALYTVGPSNELVQQRIQARKSPERAKLVSDLDGPSLQSTYDDALCDANSIPLHPPQKLNSSYLRGSDAILMSGRLVGGKYHVPSIVASQFSEKLESKLQSPLSAYINTTPKMWPLQAMYPSSSLSKLALLEKEEKFRSTEKAGLKTGLAGSTDNLKTPKDCSHTEYIADKVARRRLKQNCPLSPLSSGRKCSKSPPLEPSSAHKTKAHNDLYVGWPSVSTIISSSPRQANTQKEPNKSLSSLQQTLMECGRLNVVYEREHDKQAADVAAALDAQKKYLMEHSSWLNGTSMDAGMPKKGKNNSASDVNASANAFRSLSSNSLLSNEPLHSINSTWHGNYYKGVTHDDVSALTESKVVDPRAAKLSPNKKLDFQLRTVDAGIRRRGSSTSENFSVGSGKGRRRDLGRQSSNRSVDALTNTNSVANTHLSSQSQSTATSINCHTVSTGYMEDISQYMAAVNMSALQKNPYREARMRPTIINQVTNSLSASHDPMKYRQSSRVDQVGSFTVCTQTNMLDRNTSLRSITSTTRSSTKPSCIVTSTTRGRGSGLIPSKHEVTSSLTMLCRKALLRYDMKIVETGGLLKALEDLANEAPGIGAVLEMHRFLVFRVSRMPRKSCCEFA
jgi:hypothetical protein